MGKVIFRERKHIDAYRVIDKVCARWFDKWYIVPYTDLYYFKTGRFEYFTIAKEDIIKIEE